MSTPGAAPTDPLRRPALRLLIMGPPGAGKGTQAKVLAERLNIPAVSTGDIFRQNVKDETELGLEAKRYMDAGNYVPDEVTNAMVRDRLSEADAISATYGIPAISTGEIFRRNVAAGTPLGVRAHQVMAAGGYVDDEITNAIVASRLAEDDTRDGFLLDGYPRTLPQVTALDQLLAEQSGALTAVVVLVVDPTEVTVRLLARAAQQGRADDTAEAIRTRQQLYERETAPVLDAYRERRLVLEVDAHGPREDVTRRTLAALETSRTVRL